MCLLAIAYRVLPECPLLLLGNREERLFRPSAAPRIHHSHSRAVPWMGGTDLQAGGTWLGVNAAGLVVAITNRLRPSAPPDARSRGLLCRDLLGCPSFQSARDRAEEEFQTFPYAGCNLLILSADRAVVFHAGENRETKYLQPGLHLIGNKDLNDTADSRLGRAQTAFTPLLESQVSVQKWFMAGRKVLGRHGTGDRAALCCHRPHWGTVSSTLLALTADPQEARYAYAPGPPCRTPFNDYSPLLRELLNGSTGSRLQRKSVSVEPASRLLPDN